MILNKVPSLLRKHHMRYGLGVSQHFLTLGFGGVRLISNILKLTNLVQGLIGIILLGIPKKQEVITSIFL